jgi:hypothetical protein
MREKVRGLDELLFSPSFLERSAAPRVVPRIGTFRLRSYRLSFAVVAFDSFSFFKHRFDVLVEERSALHQQ